MSPGPSARNAMLDAGGHSGKNMQRSCPGSAPMLAMPGFTKADEDVRDAYNVGSRAGLKQAQMVGL